MDLFMQSCLEEQGASERSSRNVLLDCTSSGTLFALSPSGDLWSCDAQVLALGTEPHFLASRFRLRLPQALEGKDLTYTALVGQYVIVQASVVRCLHTTAMCTMQLTRSLLAFPTAANAKDRPGLFAIHERVSLWC
jgi:hypothetical protein